MNGITSEELRKEINKLKGQLEQLSFERDKYRKLFELSADALSILDLETGKFIECNQSAIDMHGVETEKNFLNLRPSDLSPERQPCGGSSEELAIARITKAFEEGPQIFQWVHSRLDGSTFPCLVSLTALPVADKKLVMAIGRDISDLEDTHQLLKLITENNRDYILAKDKDFRIIYGNPAFMSLYPEDKRDKVIGYTTIEDYDAKEAEAFLQQDKIAFETGQSEILEKIEFPDGERRILHTRKLRFHDSHNEPYILAVARDVTEREELVSKLLKSNEELDRTSKLNASISAEQQAIFDAMIDSLIVIDRFGVIADINKTTETLFEYERNELIGQNVKSLMDLDDAEHHDSYLANHLATGHSSIIGKGREVIAKKKSGVLFHAFISIAKYQENGDAKFVGTIRDVSHQVRKRLDLEFDALHDALTKLPTRRLISQKIDEAISEGFRDDKHFCLMFLDLNKFKPINDNFGHEMGDEVLKVIAKRLQNSLRETDICARVGGDEFVILCEPSERPIEVEKIIAKIRDTICYPIHINKQTLTVSTSIGYSAFPEDGDSMDSLIRVADQRMYIDKKGDRKDD